MSNLKGIQHLGLPTTDMDKTLDFFHTIGFEDALVTVNNGSRVVFLRLENLVIETYEETVVAGKPGAIDHVCIDVENIEEAWTWAKEKGFHILDSEIQYLPFWDNGVRFFTIMGPNGEKVEFGQVL